MTRKTATPPAGIARRDILGGSLAGGAALAGMFAASPAPAAPLPKKWDLEVDVVALGTSPGGLVGAIRAHDHGMKCAVLEVADLIGGGTAVSNGGMWIPLTRSQAAQNIPDSLETATAYVESTGFGRVEAAKLRAYFENGTKAVDYLNEKTACRIVGSIGGDYFTHNENSRPGRDVWPDLAHGARLMQERPELFANVRRPYLPMEVGGQPGVTKELGGGNILIGSLAASCADRNIPIHLNTRAQRLISDDGRVIGVQAEKEGKPFFVKARRAVLIATGGYEHNQQMLQAFSLLNAPVATGIPPHNKGDGILMGMELGAAIGLMDQGVWMAGLHTPGENFPDMPWPSESNCVVFLPGQILVNRKGQRFCDESFFPAHFKGMTQQPTNKEAEWPNWPCWVIMDQAYRDKMPFGSAAPGTGMKSWLTRADTLRALAQAIGIDADGLEATVKRFNENSKKGVDPDFGRGSDRLNPIVREVRDRARLKAKNATVAAYYVEGSRIGTLEKGPYYAARIGIGTNGTRGGLLTTPDAQVLDVQGKVIPGLYATSNAAAQTLFGGGYTSGMSIGASLVFGYVAANAIAAEGSGKKEARG